MPYDTRLLRTLLKEVPGLRCAIPKNSNAWVRAYTAGDKAFYVSAPRRNGHTVMVYATGAFFDLPDDLSLLCWAHEFVHEAQNSKE